MDSLLATLRGFGRTKLALMAVVAVLLIGAFAMIAMRVSSPALSPIYSGLSGEDSAKIATELGKMGVPYELRNNGSDIMVPSDRVLKLRMNMAEQGLPSNGSIVGYEVFDKSETFGTSQFVMNVNMQRSLEGELARTIGAFKSVESARVHLVLPRQEVFSKERRDASASVAVKLRGGQELNKQEIAAITHFVAAAVPALKTSRITVVDSYGRLLARGDGEDSIGATVSAAEEYRVSYENRMRDTLENLIEKAVGPGRVKVQIAADMNFDRITIDSEKFDPEGQVARSVQSNTQTDTAQDSAQKEAVTVANQLPAAQGAAAPGNSSSKKGDKSEETTNFEISKTVQRQVKEGGTVNRLSIAVMVDGVYAEDAEGKKQYSPRGDEELKRIESLVKTAAGFDEKRGDTVQVVNMQFSKVEVTAEEESFLAALKYQFEGIIQTLIIAGVAVLTIFVVLKPAIQQIMKLSATAGERGGDGQLALAGGSGLSLRLPGTSGVALPASNQPSAEEDEENSMVDIANIKGRVRAGTLKKVVNVVDKNPDEAMNVMRQWMNKEMI